MSTYIQKPIDAALLTQATAGINSFLRASKDSGLTIFQQDKVGVRIMAEGREGYVRLIQRLPNSIMMH